jgi:hypothetical protein
MIALPLRVDVDCLIRLRIALIYKLLIRKDTGCSNQSFMKDKLFGTTIMPIYQRQAELSTPIIPLAMKRRTGKWLSDSAA